MEKNIVKNMFTARCSARGENLDYENSDTIPDQSMSMREILNRFVKGLPLDSVSRSTYYDGEDDFDSDDPTLRSDFDLADASEMKRNIENSLLEEFTKRKAKAKAKAEATEKELDELRAIKKAGSANAGDDGKPAQRSSEADESLAG